MEFLKELLKPYIQDEAKVAEFIEKFNKENPKHFMPKSKFNEVSGELEATKTQLAETQTKITELNSAKSMESKELKEKLDSISKEYDTFKGEAEKRLTNMTKRSAMMEILNKDFIQDSVPLLIDKLELDSVVVDSKGVVVDVEKHLENLKKSYPSLVKVVKADSNGGSGGTPPLKTDVDYSTVDDETYYKEKGLKPIW